LGSRFARVSGQAMTFGILEGLRADHDLKLINKRLEIIKIVLQIDVVNRFSHSSNSPNFPEIEKQDK
jgi:hypothetical protein